jgi:hypothetical protein
MNSKVTLEWKLAFSESDGDAGEKIKGRKGEVVSLAVMMFGLKVSKLAHSKVQIDLWRCRVCTAYLSHHSQVRSRSREIRMLIFFDDAQPFAVIIVVYMPPVTGVVI